MKWNKLIRWGKKKGKEQKNEDFGNLMKFLYEWADESLFVDEIVEFMNFAKGEGYDQMDVFSFDEFLVLKKKFESLESGVYLPLKGPVQISCWSFSKSEKFLLKNFSI